MDGIVRFTNKRKGQNGEFVHAYDVKTKKRESDNASDSNDLDTQSNSRTLSVEEFQDLVKELYPSDFAQSGDISLSIGGVRARNFLNAEQAGRTFTGKDGKLRFEMDASQAKLTGNLEGIAGGGMKAGTTISNTAYKRNADGTWDVLWVPKNAKSTTDLVTVRSISTKDLEDHIPADVVLKMVNNEGEFGIVDESDVNDDLTHSKARELRDEYEFKQDFNAMPLQDVIEFDELFENYPQLKNMPVGVYPSLEGEAAYVRGDRFILVKKANNLSSVLHELQHAIQEIEGFESGSSLARELDSLNHEFDMWHAINDRFKSAVGDLHAKYGIDKASEKLKGATDIEERRKAVKMMREARKSMSDKDRDNLSSLEGNWYTHRQKRPYKPSDAEAYARYRNAGGEVEARGVQARQHLSAQQRAEQPFMEGYASFSLSPAQDAEYLSAVESGDMAKAQEMVDAAAKMAGYDSPRMYHGTATKFDTFDMERASENFEYRGHKQGMFFTTSKPQAEWFAKNASPTKEGVVLHGYVKTEGMATYEDLAWGLEYNSDPSVELDGRTTDEWMDRNPDDVEWVMDEEYTGINLLSLEKVGSQGIVTIFNPNQIKSADPVTYDSDGNVIPLSQRFDESKDSISFSLTHSQTLATLQSKIVELTGGTQAKTELYDHLKAKLEKLHTQAKEQEAEIAFDKTLEDYIDPRSTKSLRKEAAMMQALLTEEYTAEKIGELEAAEATDLHKIRTHPVHAYLADPHSNLKGSLISQSELKKQGRLDNLKPEYDGAAGLGRGLYGGTMTPDQAAQELYQEGLIKDPSPDAMWDALWREKNSVLNLKAMKQAVRDGKQRARDEAKTWLDEQLHAQEVGRNRYKYDLDQHQRALKSHNSPLARVRRSLDFL